jgi:hypothetical protein
MINGSEKSRKSPSTVSVLADIAMHDAVAPFINANKPMAL